MLLRKLVFYVFILACLTFYTSASVLAYAHYLKGPGDIKFSKKLSKYISTKKKLKEIVGKTGEARQGHFLCNNIKDKEFKTITIYERRKCNDCICNDDGKKLFQYYGVDWKNKGLKYGKQGSFWLNNNLTVNGSRTYLIGFDPNMHWLMSGIYEPSCNALGIAKNGLIFFGNDMHLASNFLLTNKEVNTDKITSQGSLQFNGFNGKQFISSPDNGILDFYVDANPILPLNKSAYLISINKNNLYRTNINDSIEILSRKKPGNSSTAVTNSFNFQGRNIEITGPLENWGKRKVLYYRY